MRQWHGSCSVMLLQLLAVLSSAGAVAPAESGPSRVNPLRSYTEYTRIESVRSSVSVLTRHNVSSLWTDTTKMAGQPHFTLIHLFVPWLHETATVRREVAGAARALRELGGRVQRRASIAEVNVHEWHIGRAFGVTELPALRIWSTVDNASWAYRGPVESAAILAQLTRLAASTRPATRLGTVAETRELLRVAKGGAVVVACLDQRTLARATRASVDSSLRRLARGCRGAATFAVSTEKSVHSLLGVKRLRNNFTGEGLAALQGISLVMTGARRLTSMYRGSLGNTSAVASWVQKFYVSSVSTITPQTLTEAAPPSGLPLVVAFHSGAADGKKLESRLSALAANATLWAGLRFGCLDQERWPELSERLRAGREVSIVLLDPHSGVSQGLLSPYAVGADGVLPVEALRQFADASLAKELSPGSLAGYSVGSAPAELSTQGMGRWRTEDGSVRTLSTTDFVSGGKQRVSPLREGAAGGLLVAFTLPWCAFCASVEPLLSEVREIGTAAGMIPQRLDLAHYTVTPSNPMPGALLDELPSLGSLPQLVYFGPSESLIYGGGWSPMGALLFAAQRATSGTMSSRDLKAVMRDAVAKVHRADSAQPKARDRRLEERPAKLNASSPYTFWVSGSRSYWKTAVTEGRSHRTLSEPSQGAGEVQVVDERRSDWESAFARNWDRLRVKELEADSASAGGAKGEKGEL